VAATIESIRAQTLDEWEYIIVDDASDDGTPQILERFAAEDKRLRMLRRDRSAGPYVAANDGLREARGRYVVRIDADDIARPTRIERQLEFLSSTGLRACATWWTRVDAEGKPAGGDVRIKSGVRSLKWRLCVGRKGLAHCTACVERSAFEEIGRYRELPASQDLRLWCDLARRHWLGIVPEVLVDVRRPGTLTSSSPDLQERLGREVLGDHLADLTGARWSDEAIRGLRPDGAGVAVGTRLSSLELWENSWRQDGSLGRGERAELRKLGRELRWLLLRRTLRQGPSSRDLLNTGLSMGRSILAARKR
jgi:glycosyltransferase involved in cell wall biosynthesis